MLSSVVSLERVREVFTNPVGILVWALTIAYFYVYVNFSWDSVV